jgi:hypothetical protein
VCRAWVQLLHPQHTDHSKCGEWLCVDPASPMAFLRCTAAESTKPCRQVPHHMHTDIPRLCPLYLRVV